MNKDEKNYVRPMPIEFARQQVRECLGYDDELIAQDIVNSFNAWLKEQGGRVSPNEIEEIGNTHGRRFKERVRQKGNN